MLKKTCPNGHVYDQSIYGDTCPLCPSSASTGSNTASNLTMAAPGEPSGAHTRVVQPTMNPGGIPNGFPNMQVQQDPTGSTKVSPNVKQQAQGTTQPQPQNGGARTTIRRNPAMMGAAVKPGENGRKLVGFLVTYNRTPMGKAFNIYEGRNYIGRDASCDISIPDDNQMSGKHMLIRYLSGNNKFSFKDEMSSNGTYVNKELLDEGELQNYDIIRVGSTLFIFIAIPQI
jgi:hypothetical protein